MEHVEAQQRRRADLRAAEEQEAHVIIGTHAQLRPERAFVPEQRRRARHVCADGNGPNGELIPRQEIAGEGKQQRRGEKNHAHDPVEFARGFVRAGEKYAKHVQPHGDDHAVRGPTVHVAQEHAERHVELQILHVRKRVLCGGAIIKHEQHARDRGDEKEQESDAAHAPREADVRAVARQLGGVEVHPKIVEHLQEAITLRIFVIVPEHGLPNLGLEKVVAHAVEECLHLLSFTVMSAGNEVILWGKAFSRARIYMMRLQMSSGEMEVRGPGAISCTCSSTRLRWAA